MQEDIFEYITINIMMHGRGLIEGGHYMFELYLLLMKHNVP